MMKRACVSVYVSELGYASLSAYCFLFALLLTALNTFLFVWIMHFAQGYVSGITLQPGITAGAGFGFEFMGTLLLLTVVRRFYL